MTDIRSGGRPREQAAATVPDAERIQPRALPARPLPARPLPARALPPRPVLDAPKAAVRKPRPDPGPLRIALALTGMATASALVTALLGSATSVDAGAANQAAGDAAALPAAAETPAASVQHVTRIIQLAPGQTAPPKAVVQQQPAPKPRVNVVVTKQSGK